jgi:CheY-like chemotaxis protein
VVETGAIPLVVLSRQQDPVETINSTLRNAGHPVHCTWVRDVSGLGDALGRDLPQAIFLCVSDPDETTAALEARQRFASRIPTILVRDSITEADLAHALEIGAQDVVTLHSRPRLQAVAIRELHSSRLDRALAGTLASARQYRDQMKAFMTGSTDAIAHVQEGIVVDVNPAWVDLFGHEEAAGLLVGQKDPIDEVPVFVLQGVDAGEAEDAGEGRVCGHQQAVRTDPEQALDGIVVQGPVLVLGGLQVRIEPGIFDGDGSLGGQQRQHFHPLRREHARQPAVLHVENAGDVAAVNDG